MKKQKSEKNNPAEVRLGPKQLTIEQILALDLDEKKKYIRSLTAKEFGDFAMPQFLENLNSSNNATI